MCAGNTADPVTVPAQVQTLQTRFGITDLVFVGDRGINTYGEFLSTEISELEETDDPAADLVAVGVAAYRRGVGGHQGVYRHALQRGGTRHAARLFLR